MYQLGVTANPTGAWSTSQSYVPNDRVYVYDALTNTTAVANVDSAGRYINSLTAKVDMSADGRYIVFVGGRTVYRDGTVLGTTTATSFMDGTAAEGDHVYAVAAVDAAGVAGEPSQTVNATVDRTAPTIQFSLNPAANGSGWIGLAGTDPTAGVVVTVTCADDRTGIASCSTPITTVDEGDNQVVTGIAVDRAGNESRVTATVRLDRT